MEKKLIAAIRKLFDDEWNNSFELGSSQTDLIEAYVVLTIKETLKQTIKGTLKQLMKQEEESLQNYIDEGVYDSEDVAGMEVWQVIEKVSKRNFSAMDNLIWHYTRITLLRELTEQGKY